MFLNRLNDNYESMRNRILLVDTLLSMSRAYSILLQIEKQLQISMYMEIEALSLEGKPHKKAFG